MEILLLESLTSEMLQNVNKLVFEYTFDVDDSIPRFVAIIAKLRQLFTHVHYTGVDETKPTFEKIGRRPQCANVYCLRVAQAPTVVESSTGSGEMTTLAPPAPAPTPPPAPAPITSHETFDVHGSVVEFNAKKRPHKNAPHTGSCIVLVFLNYDMGFIGQNNDPRTVAIKQQHKNMQGSYLQTLPCNSGVAVDEARANLMGQLSYANWESERCNNGGNHSKYSPGQQISKMSLGAKRRVSASKTKVA